MTRNIIDLVWINNKLHFLLPEDLCNTNPNVFSDLEYNSDQKVYILPSEDFGLYEKEIAETRRRMEMKKESETNEEEDDDDADIWRRVNFIEEEEEDEDEDYKQYKRHFRKSYDNEEWWEFWT